MRNLSVGVLFAAVAVVSVTAVSTPESVERLKTTGSCAGCDLFGENLSGVQAPNADLTGANLGEASFYAANLEGANLTNAVLDHANFKMANLRGATGVVLNNTITDARTICPNGENGPCE